MFRRPFTLYLSAQALITLASSMLSVAVGWHLYERTGNPFDLALVGLMQILPFAGLFIVSGWIVDHVQRKFVLMACAALQVVVLIGLSVNFEPDVFTRTAVFSFLLLNGVAKAFYMPASHSILPGIVPPNQLSRAVAISSTIRTAGEAAGPFFAGLLIAWLDIGIYRVLALSAFLAGICYLLLPTLTVRRPAGRGLSQVLDGIRFIFKNPLVLPAISLDLVLILVGSVMALLPVYAVDVLNVGPEALGLMRAMPAVGAVLAGLVFSNLGDVRHSGQVLFVSLAIFAVSIIVFALSGNLWLSLAALLVYGATDMVSVNVRMTIVHLGTPDELRGRVNAVNSLFIATSNNMGDFRSGSVAALIGPIAAVVTGGVMAIGVVVGSYFLFPRLRRLDRLTDVQTNKPDD